MALYPSNKKVTETVRYYKGNDIPNERWGKYWERRDEAKGAVAQLCYPAENSANLMQYFLLHHWCHLNILGTPFFPLENMFYSFFIMKRKSNLCFVVKKL